MSELIIYFLKLIGLITIQTFGIVIGGNIVVKYINEKLTINQSINLYDARSENKQEEKTKLKQEEKTELKQE